MPKYIDAETVKRFLKRAIFGADQKINGWVDVMPAADVRPVVRGKWVNYGDEYRPDIKCCVCGQRKPILLGNFNFNFYHNCGADMRGGDDGTV